MHVALLAILFDHKPCPNIRRQSPRTKSMEANLVNAFFILTPADDLDNTREKKDERGIPIDGE
jgi:hypothetical protein